MNNQFDDYPTEPLMRGPSISNESSYDLIVYSKDNLFSMDNSPSTAAVYIKSGESKRVGSFYLHRLYFGDSLSRFRTNYDQVSSKTNRFVAQPSFSKEAINYKILFRGRNEITIRDTLDRVILDGKGIVELHKPNGSSDPKALPFVFPPEGVLLDNEE